MNWWEEKKGITFIYIALLDHYLTVSVVLYNLTTGRGLTQPWCEPSPWGDQIRQLLIPAYCACPAYVLPVPNLHLSMVRHAWSSHLAQGCYVANWQHWDSNLQLAYSESHALFIWPHLQRTWSLNTFWRRLHFMMCENCFPVCFFEYWRASDFAHVSVGDGSLIWIWSACFPQCRRVLMSLSVFVKSLKFCFWVFCGDVVVSNDSSGFISIVWNSFF